MATHRKEIIILTSSSITGTTAIGNEEVIYIVKNTNPSTDIDVYTTSGETMDGLSTITLAGYEALTIVSDGSNWFIV